MASLFEMKNRHKFSEILNKLATSLTQEIGEKIYDEKEGSEILKAMVEAAERHIKEYNPHQMSVEKQISLLRRANYEEDWDIPQEIFDKLRKKAPPWPKGRHIYRSLRVRFGEEKKGVDLTFERHVARIKKVFGEDNFWQCKDLLPGTEPNKGPMQHLQLLNGSDTHFPEISWIMVDLHAHRYTEHIREAVGAGSLADELLVIGWMFPDMIRALRSNGVEKKVTSLVAGGYKLDKSSLDRDRFVDLLFYNDKAHVTVFIGGGNNGSTAVPTVIKS